MKTKTIVYTAYAVAAVAAYYFIYKAWKRKSKGSVKKKPETMMNADAADREKRRQIGRAHV